MDGNVHNIKNKKDLKLVNFPTYFPLRIIISHYLCPVRIKTVKPIATIIQRGSTLKADEN